MDDRILTADSSLEDLERNTVRREGGDYDIYGFNQVVRRCIKIVSEDAVRDGWKAEVKDSENGLLNDQSDYINMRFRELNVNSAIHDIFKMSLHSINGGAGVILAEGVLNYAEPPTTIKKVTQINPVRRQDDITLNIYNQTDILSKDYNKVKLTISGNSNINESFLLSCFHDLDYVGQRNITYVDDIINEAQAVLNSSTGFERVFKRLGAVLFQSPLNDLSKTDKSKISEMLNHIKLNLDSKGVMGLHPDDAVTLLNFNFGQMGNSFDVLLGLLSFVSGIPISQFKGQPRGSIITGDGMGAELEGWYNQVANKQNIKLKPMLIKIAKFIMLESEYPKSSLDQTVTIKFNPLWNVDQKTDAEIRKINAEADQIDANLQKAGPEELKQNDPRYKNAVE